MREHGAADAMAVEIRCDHEVADMAVQRAGEEILVRLQMQESTAFAIFVVRDKQVRAGRQVAQMPRDVGADAGERFVALAPWRQFECDEAFGQREDELVVIGVSEANMDGRRGVKTLPFKSSLS